MLASRTDLVCSARLNPELADRYADVEARTGHRFRKDLSMAEIIADAHGAGGGFDVRLWPDRLEKPLRWRKPRRVFVNSMSDLFMDADKVPDDFVARVFAVMASAQQHTFQVLTKRPADAVSG